jgi:hypothetical protein
MPKEISHILIAKEVLKGLKDYGAPRMAYVIERNLPTFYLGAIIPDAFFYDMTAVVKVSKSHLRISRALHLKDTTQNDKNAMKLFDGISATSPAWQAKVAFAAGIVTHTVSDRMVHGVIDYVTKRRGETDGLAMATHRELETLMDMVLLEPRALHPRRFQVERLVKVPRSTQDILFAQYLSAVAEGPRVVEPSLMRALKRAHSQQILFLRLFAKKRLCQLVAFSDRLAAGRLEPWFRLFYPEEIGTKDFPLMKRLDLNTLTDGDRFFGSFSSLVADIVSDAVRHIRIGLKRLD